MVNDWTYCEGSIVRIGRVPHKVIAIHLDGSVTVTDGLNVRTVDSSTLTPGRKGDTVVSYSQAAPARKRGER